MARLWSISPISNCFLPYTKWPSSPKLLTVTWILHSLFSLCATFCPFQVFLPLFTYSSMFKIKMHLLISILRTFLIRPCFSIPFSINIPLLMHTPSFIARVYISNRSRSGNRKQKVHSDEIVRIILWRGHLQKWAELRKWITGYRTSVSVRTLEKRIGI